MTKEIFTYAVELKKEKEVKLELKRLPKRWIPEFDML